MDFNQHLKELVTSELLVNLNLEAVDEIKSIIIDDYVSMLVDPVRGSDSRVSPEIYFDEFNKRLNEFEYVIEEDSRLSFVTPDIWTFDYRGKLMPLQNILEGTIGTYVEMDVYEYADIFKKTPNLMDILAMDAHIDDIILLVEYDAYVQAREKKVLKKKLTKFPFSNTPSIDIFYNANDSRKRIMRRWTEISINSVMDRLKFNNDWRNL